MFVVLFCPTKEPSGLCVQLTDGVMKWNEIQCKVDDTKDYSNKYNVHPML